MILEATTVTDGAKDINGANVLHFDFLNTEGDVFVSIERVAELTGLAYHNLTRNMADAKSVVFQKKKYVQVHQLATYLRSMRRFGANVDQIAFEELLTQIAALNAIEPLVKDIRPISPDVDQPNPIASLGSAGAPTSPAPKPPTPKPVSLNGHSTTTIKQEQPRPPRLERMGDAITTGLKSLLFMYLMYAVTIGIEAYLQADLFGLLIQPDDSATHNIISPRTVTWLFMPLTVTLQLIFAVLDLNGLTGKETIKLLGMELKTMNLAFAFVFIFNLSTAEYRIFHGFTFDVWANLGEVFIRALFGAVFPVMILVLGFLLGKRVGKK